MRSNKEYVITNNGELVDMTFTSEDEAMDYIKNHFMRNDGLVVWEKENYLNYQTKIKKR